MTKSEGAIRLAFADATEADALVIAALRNAVADRLTEKFGRGHWSSHTSERGVLRGIADSRVVIARNGKTLVGTLRLTTKKPWAIDPAYFTEVKRPLYLVDMAVLPGRQRRGIGRRLLEHTRRVAVSWPRDAIRLDAYDHAAGAGEFYVKCGFTERGRVVYRGTPLVYYERVLLR
jgi:GNAT superfamily N-acetyltransferase